MKLKQIKPNQTEVEVTTLPKGLADFVTDVTIFVSYQTPVAAHVAGVGFFRTAQRWSVTTSKHINQFIARNGGSGAVEVPQAVFDSLLSEVK